MTADRADLVARIERLPPLGIRLLSRLLKSSDPEQIVPFPRQDGDWLPLSYAQESIWFMEQVHAGTATYSMPAMWELGVELEVEVLERSLREIVRRHEILRTTFGVEDGAPVQRVGAVGAMSLEVVAEGGPAAEERLREAMERPFDLARGPLVRAVLIRRGRGWTLLLNVHHIVSDGWSVGIVKRELEALYAAYVQGRPSPLPELRVQYGDFVMWQREWLQGERMERLVGYWRERLAGAPEVMALPVDRARRGSQSVGGASRGVRLGRRLTAGMKELAREEGVTAFMVLVAAFAVLVERCTGQTDVVIGSPVATRSRTELEPLVGYFVNMLPLRVDVGGDPSVRQVLGRVREVLLGAYQHQELPFEQLVSALKVRRAVTHAPVFQVVVALQNVPGLEAMGGVAEAGGDDAVWVGTASRGTAKFDLTLALAEGDGAFLGAVEYRTELFEDATIEQLVRWYGQVVEAMVARPERRVSEVLKLTEEERRELVAQCERSVPERVERGETEEAAGPSTAVEAVLGRIWREVLERSEIGVGENFFDIGGNSLNAIRVMARIREALQVEVPVHVLFEAPTIRSLAPIVEAGRAEFFEESAKSATAGDGAPVPKPLRDADDPIRRLPPGLRRWRGPASFAQQRLWFLEQMEPGTPLYNVIVTLPFPAETDVAVLERSLTEVLRRHEVLRTTFTSLGGVPEQVVSPPGPVEFMHVDLGALSEAQRVDEATRRTAAELRRPFDLAKGPLFRAALLSMGSLGHSLVVTMHHIIVDGWSVGILTQEIEDIYRRLRDAHLLLPELEIQYLDFVRWQRRRLRGARLDRLLSYWRGVLAGAPPVLELPTDRPRPAIESHRGAVRAFDVPTDVSAALRAVARRARTTTFCVFAAAFEVFLARLSGSEDIVIATPIANRTLLALEPLIGLFANTLVLRTNLGGNPTFLELVDRMSAVIRGATEHQDMPFERLVEEMHPTRSLSHNPLFQVMILFQEVTHNALPPVPPQTVAAPLQSGTAKFDLTLSLVDAGSVVNGVIEYSTDLFDDETVAGFIRQFQCLLSSIALRPDQPIWFVPNMDEAERAHMISGWRVTALAPSPPAHDLVSAHASASAERLAVIHGTARLTYRELMTRSNGLVRLLRRRGVRRGDRVAICLGRGIHLTVAILATLRAGAAYVPIDRTYPLGRQAFMIEDSGAALIVTDDVSRRPALPSRIRAEVVTIADFDAFDTTWDEALDSATMDPTDPAYVMYTSGSTGQPKGVVMRHGPLAHLVRWQTERSGSAARRTLQFAPASFDVSYQEIFATWAAGGTLIVVDDESRRDPELLLAELGRHRVSRMFLPYVALQQLAEYVTGRGAELPDLEEVITAGEQLRVTPAIRAFFRRHHRAVLHNQYGPTETHVVTEYTLSGSPEGWPVLPPIGRPLPSARIYVLDRWGQPVAPGAVGELYVAGDCLASGYVDRPVETAERFRADPWAGVSGARMYRTGDLARCSRQGELHFVGRVDAQVKIRGYRVEPGEVEAVLAEHPAVADAVVVSPVGGSARRLVAYVRLADSAVIGEEVLRDYLRARLPEFMVPAAVYVLGDWPRTSSGKIDRLALPDPGTRADRTVRHSQPETPLEESLASKWSELLGLGAVELEKDLFDLGAHSLIVIQFVAWVRVTLGCEVPVRVVFQHPTVRALARAIVDTVADEVRREGAYTVLDDVERRCSLAPDDRGRGDR